MTKPCSFRTLLASYLCLSQAVYGISPSPPSFPTEDSEAFLPIALPDPVPFPLNPTGGSSGGETDYTEQNSTSAGAIPDENMLGSVPSPTPSWVPTEIEPEDESILDPQLFPIEYRLLVDNHHSEVLREDFWGSRLNLVNKSLKQPLERPLPEILDELRADEVFSKYMKQLISVIETIQLTIQNPFIQYHLITSSADIIIDLFLQHINLIPKLPKIFQVTESEIARFKALYTQGLHNPSADEQNNDDLIALLMDLGKKRDILKHEGEIFTEIAMTLLKESYALACAAPNNKSLISSPFFTAYLLSRELFNASDLVGPLLSLLLHAFHGCLQQYLEECYITPLVRNAQSHHLLSQGFSAFSYETLSVNHDPYSHAAQDLVAYLDSKKPSGINTGHPTLTDIVYFMAYLIKSGKVSDFNLPPTKSKITKRLTSWIKSWLKNGSHSFIDLFDILPSFLAHTPQSETPIVLSLITSQSRDKALFDQVLKILQKSDGDLAQLKIALSDLQLTGEELTSSYLPLTLHFLKQAILNGIFDALMEQISLAEKYWDEISKTLLRDPSPDEIKEKIKPLINLLRPLLTQLLTYGQYYGFLERETLPRKIDQIINLLLSEKAKKLKCDKIPLVYPWTNITQNIIEYIKFPFCPTTLESLCLYLSTFAGDPLPAGLEPKPLDTKTDLLSSLPLFESLLKYGVSAQKIQINTRTTLTALGIQEANLLSYNKKIQHGLQRLAIHLHLTLGPIFELSPTPQVMTSISLLVKKMCDDLLKSGQVDEIPPSPSEDMDSLEIIEPRILLQNSTYHLEMFSTDFDLIPLSPGLPPAIFQLMQPIPENTFQEEKVNLALLEDKFAQAIRLLFDNLPKIGREIVLSFRSEIEFLATLPPENGPFSVEGCTVLMNILMKICLKQELYSKEELLTLSYTLFGSLNPSLNNNLFKWLHKLIEKTLSGERSPDLAPTPDTSEYLKRLDLQRLNLIVSFLKIAKLHDTSPQSTTPNEDAVLKDCLKNLVAYAQRQELLTHSSAQNDLMKRLPNIILKRMGQLSLTKDTFHNYLIMNDRFNGILSDCLDHLDVLSNSHLQEMKGFCSSLQDQLKNIESFFSNPEACISRTQKLLEFLGLIIADLNPENHESLHRLLTHKMHPGAQDFYSHLKIFTSAFLKEKEKITQRKLADEFFNKIFTLSLLHSEWKPQIEAQTASFSAAPLPIFKTLFIELYHNLENLLSEPAFSWNKMGSLIKTVNEFLNHKDFPKKLETIDLKPIDPKNLIKKIQFSSPLIHSSFHILLRQFYTLLRDPAEYSIPNYIAFFSVLIDRLEEKSKLSEFTPFTAVVIIISICFRIEKLRKYKLINPPLPKNTENESHYSDEAIALQNAFREIETALKHDPNGDYLLELESVLINASNTIRTHPGNFYAQFDVIIQDIIALGSQLKESLAKVTLDQQNKSQKPQKEDKEFLAFFKNLTDLVHKPHDLWKDKLSQIFTFVRDQRKRESYIDRILDPSHPFNQRLLHLFLTARGGAAHEAQYELLKAFCKAIKHLLNLLTDHHVEELTQVAMETPAIIQHLQTYAEQQTTELNPLLSTSTTLQLIASALQQEFEERARRKAEEEEAMRKAKEAEAQAEAARRKAKEEYKTQQAEAARRKAQAEVAQRKAKEEYKTQQAEARRKAQAEAARRKAEQEVKAQQEEMQRKAKEEADKQLARWKAEAEARQKAEEEARRKAEAEAQAEEEARRKAEEERQTQELLSQAAASAPIPIPQRRDHTQTSTGRPREYHFNLGCTFFDKSLQTPPHYISPSSAENSPGSTAPSEGSQSHSPASRAPRFEGGSSPWGVLSGHSAPSMDGIFTSQWDCLNHRPYANLDHIREFIPTHYQELADNAAHLLNTPHYHGRVSQGTITSEEIIDFLATGRLDPQELQNFILDCINNPRPQTIAAIIHQFRERIHQLRNAHSPGPGEVQKNTFRKYPDPGAGSSSPGSFWGISSHSGSSIW